MYAVYFEYMKNFKGRYYLVTPLTEVSHMTICEAQPDIPLRYVDTFFLFWHQNHFLVGMTTYIYLPDDLFEEEAYLNNKLMDF